MRARLLELLIGQCIALGPFVALWWFVYLDADDRADQLDRIGAAIYRWTGGELRDWLESPAAGLARFRAPQMLASEFVVAVPGAGDPPLWWDAFMAKLDASVDELEAEGID